MSIKDKLIQVILQGRDLLSPAAKKSRDALKELRDESETLRTELDKAQENIGLVNTITRLTKEAHVTQATIVRTERQIKDLRAELEANPDSKGLAQSLRDVERESEKARKKLDELGVENGQLLIKAHEAGIKVHDLASEEKRLATELDTAKKALQANGNQTRQLEQEQRKAARAAEQQARSTDTIKEAMKAARKEVWSFVGSYLSLKAAYNALKSVTGTVVDGFKSIFASASESEQVLAQLDAALLSTGNQIGMTAEELQKMALAMRDTSMRSTEDITAMQVSLLTYTNIAKEEFPRALQIAIDQQQRFGMDITRSAELVGKALQRPSKAMKALSEQGFELTASQQQLLKNLERSGQMAKAQSMIIDLMTESYGKAAQAARDGTLAGSIKGIGDKWDDFKSKVADAGAFTFLKNKLDEFYKKLQEMEQDGSLARLATSISDMFVNGATWVENFVKSTLKIDFKTIDKDAAALASNFGGYLDDIKYRFELFTAPFRIFYHGLKSGISSIGMYFTWLWDVMLSGAEQMAKVVPDMFGGDKLAENIKNARKELDHFHGYFEESVNSSGEEIRKAWDTLTGDAKQSFADQEKAAAESAAEIARKQKEEQEKQTKQLAAESENRRKLILDEIQAQTELSVIFNAIDTTKSVAEVEKLKAAFWQMYQEGKISQEAFNGLSYALSEQLKNLGGSAVEAGKDLESLEGILRAIGSAKNDLDIAMAKNALNKMYREGMIGQEELTRGQEALNRKVAELKSISASTGSSFVEDQQVQRVEVEQTTESYRKAIGNQMEANRRFSGSMGDVSDSVMQSAAAVNWFDQVLTNARTPLAQMSEEALAAFDKLQGIKNVDTDIDLSGIDALKNKLQETEESIARIRSLNHFNDGFNIWQYKTLMNSKQIQKEFLQQRLEVERLVESYERGGMTAVEFQKQAAAANKNMKLLGENDLQGLNSALDAANQRIAQMNESTQQTLQSLNEELLQLEGRQDAIEQSRDQAKRNDLNRQLAEAQASGDKEAIANMQKAIETLGKIEDQRARNARDEVARKEQDERDKAAKEAEQEQQRIEREKQTVEPAVEQPKQPTQVIQLELAGKKPLTVEVDGERGGDELLDILKEAGLRTR